MPFPNSSQIPDSKLFHLQLLGREINLFSGTACGWEVGILLEFWCPAGHIQTLIWNPQAWGEHGYTADRGKQSLTKALRSKSNKILVTWLVAGLCGCSGRKMRPEMQAWGRPFNIRKVWPRSWFNKGGLSHGLQKRKPFAVFPQGEEREKGVLFQYFKYSLKAVRMGLNTWMATKTGVLCGKSTAEKSRGDFCILT